MAFFREFLKRYGAFVQTWFNSRSHKQQQRIFTQELSLVYCQGTIKQHPFQYSNQNTKRKNDCSSSCQRVQHQTCNNLCKDKKGVGRKRFAQVYDIINTGPHNRFLIRNSNGYEFLVHNCSGAIYDQNGEYHLIDTQRYELVSDLIEETAHSVCFFNWRHQKELLSQALNARGIPYAILDGTVNVKERERLVFQYQRGDLQTILLHPQTGAHGLTLTKGTRTIWSSPIYQADFLVQGKHRIYRGGQTLKTETILVEAEGTIEERIYAKLNDNETKMMSFLDLIKGR